MKVVSLNDQAESKRKASLLEILDGFRAGIESGEIDEFVIAGMDADGEVQIYACVKDFVGGVGLFEIGKHILISQEG